MTTPRLFLIDGYSNIFRAFYAIPSLSNSKGLPTNAVYGFINMLRKLLRDEKPELVGIALDTGGPTFRDEAYSAYKANRSPMPADLKTQLPYVRRAIEAFRIPILELVRYEADDVLGTLTKKAVAAGYEVVLVTADKDFMQLVGPQVCIHHTMRDKVYGPAEVEEYFGVGPDRVIDVLALMGDSVDNVPGVPGIGEKGAQKLIQEFGTLEALLDRAAEVPRKNYREGLQQHRDQALLSKKLVTIETELDIDLDPAALRLEEPDRELLIELCRELEFFTWLEELGGTRPELADEVEPATDLTVVEEVMRRLPGAAGGRVVLSLVGRGGDDVLGAAWRFAEQESDAGVDGASSGGRGAEAGNERGIERTVHEPANEACFVDFRRAGLREAFSNGLLAVLADPEATLVAHDAKEVLRSVGAAKFPVRCRLVDTMLLAYLLPGAARGSSLSEVVQDRLRHSLISAEEAGFSKNEEPMSGFEPLRRFAGERLAVVAALAALLEAELKVEQESGAGSPREVYERIEAPLLPVLLRMEEAGIGLDTEFLREMSAQLQEELRKLEAEIYEIAGEPFNIQSPQQLGTILFDKLGYPAGKKTRKTKSYSTGAETLEALAAQGFDLPGKILAFREKAKLKSTYVDALPLLVGQDGRLHTRFHQAIASTGRLSSASPNLQNIPVRTEEGQRIRKAFRAAPGMALLVADYSQIELRVLAHIAEEPALVKAFALGEDVHRATAATVFGSVPGLVTDEQRRAAKTINFGIIYGMSAFGLSQRLGIPNKDAQKFIDAYFEQFPQVRRYMDETITAAEECGYVETLYGRTRFLPDVKSRNWNLRENAKRMAINARIQGTAADLLKLAMIAVERRLEADFPEARLLLTVHDELVLEVPFKAAAELTPALREEMEGVAELAVPLVVDVGTGATWYEAKN